jgi:hypothetical protein
MAPAGIPADGPVRLGSEQFPDGRQLWDQYFDASASDRYADAPLLWATNEPVPDAAQVWQVLTRMHPDTGLVPILLAFLDDEHEGRPWDEGELDFRCDLAAVDRLDAASVLAEAWAGQTPSPDQVEREPDLADWFAPFGLEFPGLAPGQDQELTSAELDAALGWFGPARIGLVPAARPADVLALVGYNGTVNRYSTPECCRQSCGRGRTGSARCWWRSASPTSGCWPGARRGPCSTPRRWPPSCTSCLMSSGRSTSPARRKRSSGGSRSTSCASPSGRCGWTREPSLVSPRL